MNNYVCEKCQKTFSKKSHLERHQYENKYSCKAIGTEIIQDPPGFLQDPPRTLQGSSKILQDPPKILQILQKPEEFAPSSGTPSIDSEQNFTCVKGYGCPNCGTNFKRKDNLKRHMEARCKQKILLEYNIKKSDDIDVNLDELDIDKRTKKVLGILINQNKILLEEVDKLKNENNKFKFKDGLEFVDKKLISSELINITN